MKNRFTIAFIALLIITSAKAQINPVIELSASNISSTSFRLNWVKGYSSSWGVIDFYALNGSHTGSLGFDPWGNSVGCANAASCDALTSPVASSLVITNLNPGTTYRIHMTIFDDGNSYSYDTTKEPLVITTKQSNQGVQGSSFENPIVLPLMGMDQTIHVTGNNRSTSGFKNVYNGPNARPGNDVIYELTMDPLYANVSITTCGSSLDTYIHLLSKTGNGTWSYITSNDDSRQTGCNRFDSKIGPIELWGSGIQGQPGNSYYIVVEGYSTRSGNFQLRIDNERGRYARLGKDDQSEITKTKATLAPNPVTSTGTTLNLSVAQDQKVSALLINSVGQLTKEFSLELRKGSNAKKLSFDRLENGLYMLKLNLASGPIVKRIKIDR